MYNRERVLYKTTKKVEIYSLHSHILPTLVETRTRISKMEEAKQARTASFSPDVAVEFRRFLV